MEGETDMKARYFLVIAVSLFLIARLSTPLRAGWTVVNLRPTGAQYSCATGTSGGQQVGYARFADNPHAGLWSGTAGSWVDLNPAGALDSRAYAVSGGQQVGDSTVGVKAHAALWSGTAESWVDLNPAGALGSRAYGVSDGQQAGSAAVGDYPHAALWTGSAESWLDLNPAGATSSQAWGVSGGRQVGYASFGGLYRASLWSGTAASWVDLHAVLPAGVYSSSDARSIDVSFGETWVAGYAHNPSTGQDEAMLWHYVVPEPSSLIALGALLTPLLAFRRRRA